MKIEFSKSVNDIIYSEGVYPTQGVRPIFTSIHQVLKSKMSLFLTDIFLNSIDTDKLYFSVEGNILKCIYLKNEKQAYEKQVGFCRIC